MTFENKDTITTEVDKTMLVSISLPESTGTNVAVDIPNSKKAKTESSVPEVKVNEYKLFNCVRVRIIWNGIQRKMGRVGCCSKGIDNSQKES